MKVLYSSWMQELDARAIEGIGIPSIVLMENASMGAARYFREVFPLCRFKNVIVAAGKGNNGGDGIAVGRILHQWGYSVKFVLLSSPEKFNPDPAINFKIIENLKLDYFIIDEDESLDKAFHLENPGGTFIIDAIFGTGLSKPVGPDSIYGRVIETVNSSTAPVAAIDIPSGLSESFLPGTGLHVKADITATFQALKVAHLHPDGNKHCGRIRIVDIGIPRELFEKEEYYLHLVDPGFFAPLLRNRDVDAHKGDFGHALTISGSIEKPGAGILSAYSVLKSGAGLCTAAVAYDNRLAPVISHPELMTLVYEKNDDLLTRLTEFDVIMAGPGLGNTDNTSGLVSLLLHHAEVPLVLDADAVNMLHKYKEILKSHDKAPVILTPHPGEFSRLTGIPVSRINSDRIGVSREFAMEYGVYLVLKGHHTVIATPNGQVFLNQSGNPGMATAGSGDVLCGIIAGMIAQYCKTEDIATILQAAVFLHGYAGDLAAAGTGEISLTAGDIIENIPGAILKLNEFCSPFQFA